MCVVQETGSKINFPAGGSTGVTASTSRVAASTAVDQSFVQEAAAAVAKTGGKTNKKKSKKKGKR